MDTGEQSSFAGDLEKLCSGELLFDENLDKWFAKMLQGELSESQIAGFLIGLRCQEMHSSVLRSGAAAMRRHAVAPGSLTGLVDNCGTGGDGADSFNISTASAIVAASLGVPLAKHGNRSVSSRCGSADLMFAAGVPPDLSPSRCFELLKETGFAFFFAPGFHPGMKYVMPVRKQLGIRTVFNLLGPLANPMQPQTQLIGVGSAADLLPMADAASRIGVDAVATVHSRDGLDEISPSAQTDVVVFRKGVRSNLIIEPASYGLAASPQSIAGGSADQNLEILQRLLAGQQDGPFAAVVLNTGFLLWLAGVAESLESGFGRVAEYLRSGSVEKWFHDWLKRTRSEL